MERSVLGGRCAACLLRTALDESGSGEEIFPADASTPENGAETGAPEAPEPVSGESLAGRTIGRYRLVERLAEGGMGVVYRAIDQRLERAVAFKLVAPALVDAPAAREQFEAEARAASALEHPNVCAVFDVGDSPHGSYLVLPLYEGETLAERLERGPLSAEQALDVVRQTAEGLARAHREGIVHGDVKPENLMLTADGEVKILDFGLAGVSGQRVRRAGGTDGYIAPEAGAAGRLDPRADLYSLGVVLADVLLGRAGPHSLPLCPLEPALDTLLERCLEPDPVRRIGSAREVLEALERVDPLEVMVALGELPSPDVVATSRARLPSRRATAVAALALLLGLALAASLVERLDGWNALGSQSTVGSLLETARAAADLREPAASVRWGFVLDRTAWAEERETSAVALWWRASRRPLVGSPNVVRALDLGRVGPSEPVAGANDLAGVRVGLDGSVIGLGAENRDPVDTTEPVDTLYGFHPLLFAVAFGILLVVSVALARRNLARGQGDRRGAGRLAALLGVLFLASWVAGGGHAPTLRQEFSLFVQASGLALFYAALAGLFYLALEPRLRRHWPHVQIGWSRLFAGRLADGVVARELLAGALLGVGWFLARLAVLGSAGGAIRTPNVRLLEGAGQIVGELTNSLGTALALGLGVVVVMALLRERTPPRRLSPWLFAALVTPALALAESSPAAWIFWAAVALSARWTVGRFGALSLVAAYLAFRLLWMGLLTPVPGRLGFALTAGTAGLVLLLGLGPMLAHLARATARPG